MAATPQTAVPFVSGLPACDLREAPAHPRAARALASFLLDSSLTATSTVEACLAGRDLGPFEEVVERALEFADVSALAGQRVHGATGGGWLRHRELLAQVADSAARLVEACVRAPSHTALHACAASARTCRSLTREILTLLDG